MSRDGYNTDERLLDAIEAVTAGNLDCAGECGQGGCDGDHPENCDDPAVVLWRDGGRETELHAWLDVRRPGWRADAPLPWGEGELEEAAV